MTTTDTPRMTAPETAQLQAALGDAKPRLVLRSRSRIDTGRWMGRSRLWVCVTDQKLIVFAAARRRYCEQLPLTDAQESWYCHTTGELVIESPRPLTHPRLSLGPNDALRVLACIASPPDTKSHTMQTES